MKYCHQFPDLSKILYLWKFSNDVPKWTLSNNELYTELWFKESYTSKTLQLFKFFVVFQIFLGSYLQMVLHCHHCFYEVFCWSRQCTLQLASEIFFCEQSYSHYCLGKLDSQSRATARQPDTVNNFTTSEHLELIRWGPNFYHQRKQGMTLAISESQFSKVSFSTNEQQWALGYRYRWILDMFSKVYNLQTSSFKACIHFTIFNTLTLCELVLLHFWFISLTFKRLYGKRNYDIWKSTFKFFFSLH